MVLFQLLYTAIFASFWPRMSLIEAAEVAATNVLPLGLLTLVVRAILNGRMTAHLSNGAAAEVSRTGTQVLRRFIV